MTITRAYEVPKPGSKEHAALEALVGQPLDVGTNGVLVGFAAGKAAAALPEGAVVKRVVVVAECAKGDGK